MTNGYSCRPIAQADFSIITNFPLSAEELFYMFPSAKFPLTPNQLEATSESRINPTVIMFNDTVIGYANLYDLEENKLCWLGNVIISSAFRGKGAAAYLIKAMMDIAKNELKVSALHLVCHNTNVRGLLFYTKMKFKPYDLVQREYKEQTIVGIRMKIDF
jgi:RimJ/RimL family protein N-acetyltransferase